jgi:chemotaxis protein MotC
VSLPRSPRRLRAARAALATLFLAAPAAAQDEAPLEPYQMVRSLQLVQDRIAAGDHAALPMQSKLLEMIDRRFRATSSEDYVDERNYQALLVYAMSGGNPATIDALLAKLHLDETDRALGSGILGYLKGDMDTAREALGPVDPLSETPELGAFLALVKGSITAPEDARAAVRMFDEARLLSPGTLVEEAALRRTIGLPSGLDGPRLLMAASQYVRRFLHSPYASQFVDVLVAGVVALNQTIDLDQLDRVIGEMDPERQRVVYLRLARRAGIDGVPGLAQYASEKAKAINADAPDPTLDPRAQLYSSLGAITSDTVGQVLPQLEAIDRERLSEADRRLLDAAEAIATAVTARPEQPAAPAAPVAPPAGAPAADTAGSDASSEDGLPVAEPLDQGSATIATPANAASPAPDGPAAAPAEAAQAVMPAEPRPAAASAPSADTAAAAPQAAAGSPQEASTVDGGQTSAIVEDARKKLDDIDKLLKESSQ